MQLTDSFWEGLLSGTISGIISGTIIAFLFGYLFVKWLNFYNRPKLTLELESKPTLNEINIKWLILGAHNKGKTAINDREANFHLYLPEKFEISSEQLTKFGFQALGTSNIKEKKYIHYSAYNQTPIFPCRETRIINIQYFSNKNKQRIYYHFATIYGLTPTRGKWWKKINKRNNEIRVELLPYVEFN
ncbi:hypothetical protein L6259_00440 [Candidatus Parcubacteria bacterium]|nr:hypothetical protein [Candidatus Parcubacteria bacterium]